jgi:hypothetical protein
MRSRDGRLGRGFDQTRPGYVVCVFKGGGLPFVLRPVMTGEFE